MRLHLFLIFLFCFTSYAQDYQYIGSQACKKCHMSQKKGSQYVSWMSSRHAHAYWRLKSEWSLFLAHRREEYKDITEPITEHRCLKCHTTQKEDPVEMLAETYNIEEGVGCESCHGPASVYIKTHMKKDRTTLDDGGTKPTEEICKKCHRDDKFVFEEKVEKIKHPFPKEDS